MHGIEMCQTRHTPLLLISETDIRQMNTLDWPE